MNGLQVPYTILKEVENIGGPVTGSTVEKQVTVKT
jgi:hypothetical protein